MGWRHNQHPISGIEADAGVVPEVPHSGKLSLHLKAKALPFDTAPPDVMETAPISVSTPAIPISAGQIAWIHGWVRMTRPVTASVDGLLIFDSIVGEPLAERVGPTVGWIDRDRARKGLKPRAVKKDKDQKPEKEKPEEAWQEFAMYRAAPQTGTLTVTFALTGLGEAWIDDVCVQFIDR